MSRLDRVVRLRIDSGGRPNEHTLNSRFRRALDLVQGVEDDEPDRRLRPRRAAPRRSCCSRAGRSGPAATPARSASESSPRVDTSAPSPCAGEQAKEGEALERLQAVEDPRVRRGVSIGASRVEQRVFAVDDERRSELLGQGRGGDAADGQLAVVDRGGVGKEVEHGPILPVRSGRFRAVPLALETGHAVGLGLVAGAFVVFALLSALVIPRRWPQYPGRGLGWFIVGTLVLFVATLGAVEVFAKEAEEEVAVSETTTETGGTTTEGTTTGEAQPPPPPAGSEGDPAAGKPVFAAQGCGGCHTFSAAGTSASVGPDLDEALQGMDPGAVRESIVDPNAEITSGYAPSIMPQDFEQKLTPKQLDDLVAFLLQSP